jgi:hypothetical protein
VDNRARNIVRIDFVSDRPITQETDVFIKDLSSDLRGLLFDCKNITASYVPVRLNQSASGTKSYHIYVDNNLTRRQKTVDGRPVGDRWRKEELITNGFCFALVNPSIFSPPLEHSFRSNVVDVSEYLQLFD